MSMYREPNDRDPLNFNEVVLVGEKQKFRVEFTLIWYMSSIFTTYVSQNDGTLIESVFLLNVP